jgi:serine/threonine-protein kinase
VRVLDHGVADDGTLFLVMELLVGKTLRNLIRVHGSLEVSHVADIGVQICRSLEEAHRLGIVHRDLKPENVFICDDAEGRPLVRVLDYGCARLAHGVAAASGAGPGFEMNTLTVVGTLIGTPRYMSPEQCMGIEVDRRSDLYSLGIILYEMLSGHAPFEDDVTLRLLGRHMSEPPPPLTARERLPAALEAMVLALLEKEPAKRPARALDVIEVLLDMLAVPERTPVTPTEVTWDDQTQAAPPPRFPRTGEITLRDLEPPSGMQEEEVDEDHTVPWTRPYGLSTLIPSFVTPPTPPDEPTIRERKRK